MTIINTTPAPSTLALSADPFTCTRCRGFEFCERCGAGPQPGTCMGRTQLCPDCTTATYAIHKAMSDKATMRDLADTLTKGARTLRTYNAQTGTVSVAGDVLNATWVDCVNEMLSHLEEFATNTVFRVTTEDTWQSIRTLALILAATAND